MRTIRKITFGEFEVVGEFNDIDNILKNDSPQILKDVKEYLKNEKQKNKK